MLAACSRRNPNHAHQSSNQRRRELRVAVLSAAGTGVLGGGRLLIVTLSNIGDLVMTTPVFEALHRKYPACLIDVVADARSSELLAGAPYCGDIFLRNKRGGWVEQWRLVQRLRARTYELIVDLRTPFIPLLVRARRRVLKIGLKPRGPHAVEEHFATLDGIVEKDTAIPPCRVYIPNARAAAAGERAAALPGRRWLAVAPGAKWPGKKWPTANYCELLTAVQGAFDAAIILGDAGDRTTAAAVGAADFPTLDMTGRTRLIEAAALIARATAFVGNDSGLGHVAAALGCPTVTVFGPGQPQRYRPWGERVRLVRAPMQDLARLEPATVAVALREVACGG